MREHRRLIDALLEHHEDIHEPSSLREFTRLLRTTTATTTEALALHHRPAPASCTCIVHLHYPGEWPGITCDAAHTHSWDAFPSV